MLVFLSSFLSQSNKLDILHSKIFFSWPFMLKAIHFFDMCFILTTNCVQALDHVIVEARKNGVRLLLSLVNNLQAYGGKTQYVNWAWEEGIGISSSNDSFFFDPSIHKYFKHYVKVCCFLALTTMSVFRSD